MFARIALSALAFISFSAAAAPIHVDFEGVTRGAGVCEFYNGGTDCAGKQGTVNYGISFTGGEVIYDRFGAKLVGPTTVTFNNSIVGQGIHMWTRGVQPESNSYILVDGRKMETVYTPDPFWNPLGQKQFQDGQLFSTWVTNYWPTNGLLLLTKELDDMLFNYPMPYGWTTPITKTNNSTRDQIASNGGSGGSAAGIEVKQGEVPLPGTAWLLGIGALAFLRRKKA
jgi:hypothetical protein